MSEHPLALVVEDEPDQADLLRRYLERADFRVVSVATAEQALVLLDEIHPVLAIVDLVLPGLSGEHLAERIRASHPQCYLVISSVHSAARYPQSDGQLPKPFTGEQVREIAHRASTA